MASISIAHTYAGEDLKAEVDAQDETITFSRTGFANTSLFRIDFDEWDEFKALLAAMGDPTDT